MSKIGFLTITVPAGVTVTTQDNKVTVTGSQGTLSYELPSEITISQEAGKVSVHRANEVKEVKALHGLWRSILNNAIVGVVKPWESRLEVVGTGYNVKAEGKNIVLKVGYSHLVPVEPPTGISFVVEGNNKIVVKGIDKQQVGEVAHKIKMIKKPDPYKGKGVRYEGEVVRLRAGKKAKAGA